MLPFLAIGTMLGISAGFAPGPLLALVVSETLQHDLKAGIKVSLAPILTDIPIIMATLFIMEKLSGFNHVVGIISIIGAFFILYLGIKNFKTRPVDLDKYIKEPKSLLKGIVVNALSPHPYLFWLTVGGPTTLKAMAVGLSAAASFVMSFYLLLVGSKVMLALMTNKSRVFLQGNKYIYTIRLLGIVLLIFAFFL
ncbi:MAG: LysE family transporter, partial [Deltaproteobacteria bacterium]|nr:LysE family transporter [Deltaproteobacteria bacterium]